MDTFYGLENGEKKKVYVRNAARLWIGPEHFVAFALSNQIFLRKNIHKLLMKRESAMPVGSRVIGRAATVQLVPRIENSNLE